MNKTPEVSSDALASMGIHETFIRGSEDINLPRPEEIFLELNKSATAVVIDVHIYRRDEIWIKFRRYT